MPKLYYPYDYRKDVSDLTKGTSRSQIIYFPKFQVTKPSEINQGVLYEVMRSLIEGGFEPIEILEALETPNKKDKQFIARTSRGLEVSVYMAMFGIIKNKFKRYETEYFLMRDLQ